MSLLKSSHSNVVHADVSTFSSAPSCSQQPVQTTQLANKAYVDAAIAAAPPPAPTVESVSGTTALNPDISISLVSGTTHALGNSTQPVGFEKTIVNTNPTDAISRIFTFPVSSVSNNFSDQPAFYALAYYPATTTMYVGGKFDNIQGVSFSGIAAYNFTTATWSALSTGITSGNLNVYTLLIKGTRLYVGGDFTAAGGVANTGYIAYWDLVANTWNALGTGLTGGSCRFLYTTPAYPNDVFATGSFTLAGGVADTVRIARFNETAGTWNPLGKGLNQDGKSILYVNNLFVVGGAFTAVGNAVAGDVATPYLALWNPVNSTWYGYGSDLLNGGVYTLTMFGASNIVISGLFTQIGSGGSARLLFRCAQVPIASITTTGPLTFTQFASIIANTFFTDASGTLWAATSNYVNGIERFQASSNNVTPFNAGFVFYDPASQSWVPVMGLLGVNTAGLPNCIAATNNPDVLWLGSSFSCVDLTLGGANSMVALDTSKITRVTGSFKVNGFTRTTMQMLYSDQAATLMKVGNAGWMVKNTAPSLAIANAIQTPVWFY